MANLLGQVFFRCRGAAIPSRRAGKSLLLGVRHASGFSSSISNKVVIAAGLGVMGISLYGVGY